MANIFQLDLRMLLWFAKIEQKPRWCLAGKCISKTGDGYLQAALPLLIWLANVNAAAQFVISCLIAFSIERPVYFVLKNSLKRRRPPQAIPYFNSTIIASDEFSFPSGHTSAAFLLAYISWQFFAVLGLILFAWAILVGCSRVLLGVHFPSDIIAGASLGLCIGYSIVNFIY